ncbi:MAG: diaminopimelate epimerase [Lachnospiraceae bacterium]|nr:diaminopimelate epimerase [Lachnospiraceae bacterium]
MRFTKMHGIGNDYIYIDTFTQNIDEKDRSKMVKEFSDRRFGIGGDGVIFINPSELCDCEMEMYNSDGTRAEMCGNGIRCVGKYVYDYGIVDKKEISVVSAGKIKYLNMETEKESQNPYTGKTWGRRKDGSVVCTVRVDMGEPIFTPEEVPVNIITDDIKTVDIDGKSQKICLMQPIQTDSREYKMTCVSMGNPHAVIFMEDVEHFPVEVEGPKLEHHPCFPNRVNTEFVQILDRDNLQMRVWERGAGETLACGTGACAVAAAAILNGFTNRTVTVHLRGGDLSITWDGDTNHIFMTGTAVTVFEGEI